MSKIIFNREYELSELVSFVGEKIEAEQVTTNTYISTDNMLVDRGGVEPASKLPSVNRFNHFKIGDTLFSNIRTYFRKVWLADFEGGASADVLIFRTDDDKVLDPYYLYFLLSNEDFVNYTVLTAKGAKMPRGDKAAIMQYKFLLPGIDKQREIGLKLLDINKKIQLNRQTNQTLEHIAQAIFKSWFVDFEPTRAKIIIKQKGGNELAQELAAQAVICGAITLHKLAELEEGLCGIEKELHPLITKRFPNEGGVDLWQPQQLAAIAALFPNSLVDSELGEVPEGWVTRSFGDVSQCFDSKRIPLSKKKREEKKPGNIPYYGATSIMDYVNEWVFDDIYLLLGEDGSVIKEDGTPFVQYIWGKAWVNNHAHVLQGRNGVSTEQLMTFIQNKNIAAYITGAVQLKLNQGNMNSIPFLDAGEEINGAFYELISPLYEKNRKTIESNKVLEELRDALLPKLLSGELTTTTTTKKAKHV
ncbi:MULTISPECIES: restriction endonuclease subunit S [Cycloclasticus]|uniref:Type I restriction modification DNA specificity domain-containing protein n=1 Tax=Cycloclasticus pugetii TaxID=34068 RepID=A0AB33Z526_9GAMM|nr:MULTISPECIES: restriction endonuclease subunit S [Cycloclasticus]ATI04175.2 restriction endonuclease subunit S [Cycloclasticus sp. PY97N]EPD14051.1 hypothetical protein L196_01090 [Cycloclasticus pugetii]